MPNSHALIAAPESEDEFRIYLDTRIPVKLEDLGKFLTAFGRQFDREESEYFLELSDVNLSSLDLRFRAKRKRDAKKIDGRGNPSSLSEIKRAKILSIIAVALAAPSAAEATLNLIDRYQGSQVKVQAKELPPREITQSDLERHVQRHAMMKYKARSLPKVEEQKLLESYLERGENLKLAGTIMPRKDRTFRTAKGNQYPIIANLVEAPKGRLLKIVAEVTYDNFEKPGLVILESEILDDR